MRKRMLLLSAVLLFGAFCTTSAFCKNKAKETTSRETMNKEKNITFHFIETTDVHGSFFPYDFINRTPKAGSLSRVSTYVNRMRGEFGKNVILLENGDFLQGQPTCYYYNYIDTTCHNVGSEVINYLKYDVAAMGNHDVETGHKVFDKWISELNCPVVGANVMDTKTGECYVKPYTVIERDGVKIAVLGLLTPAIPNWLSKDLWTNMRFDNMVTSAKTWMKHIKEVEKPDIVIGLFHSGKDGGIVTPEYEEDATMRIAKEVPGFDVIFFGHDHKQCNETVSNSDGKSVLCLNPANNARFVADAEITVSINGKGSKRSVTKNVKGSLQNVCEEANDEKYLETFAPQIEKVKNYVGRKIGEFENTVYTRDCFFGSSAFNDFILNTEMTLSKADIAINASSEFDAKIEKGDIHVSDLFKLYKFENKLYTMRLTGEEVRKHLEMSYDLWVNTMKSSDDHLFLLNLSNSDNQHTGFKNFTFNFDAASGIDYEVDVTKPDGQKVKILRMSNGEPFDPDKTYNVCLNSYRGNGGGELLTKGAGIKKEDLEKRIVWRSEMDLRYYIMKEIERQGHVNPQPNNNWKFVPEDIVKPAAERDYKLLFGDK